MSKSVSVIFIIGCAVLVCRSSSIPYKEIFAFDSKIDNGIGIVPNTLNGSFNGINTTAPNCLETTTTFCTRVDSYPEEEIQKILNERYYDLYFKNRYPVGISERNNFEDKDTNLCDTQSELIKPKLGITADNVMELVVNIGMKYAQEIRVIKCIESSICNRVDDMDGYESYCKQKYTYQRLLSVDASFTKLSIKLFQTPSGCCCATGKIGNSTSEEN